MKELSEDLKNNLYYLEIIDALIEEYNIELKNSYQLRDEYTEFIQNESARLMDDTVKLIREKEISFIQASATVIEDWKEQTFM
ncbi:hypothetical protein [Hyunsoonleella pacifica]|jgi:hypothetical protein|uniref:Uncharacterized protein n=1 Tax=Hyunsoonleella pacifica TaxID=1080224 RepID=A0A4Q9FMK7_9FLAO|nr:hypothetical protein [Hyunsoonleella pacifica]TBN14396.1 hypothetical protein EYD46_12540 [Hyunsoonleella pacifica]